MCLASWCVQIILREAKPEARMKSMSQLVSLDTHRTMRWEAVWRTFVANGAPLQIELLQGWQGCDRAQRAVADAAAARQAQPRQLRQPPQPRHARIAHLATRKGTTGPSYSSHESRGSWRATQAASWHVKCRETPLYA